MRLRRRRQGDIQGDRRGAGAVTPVLVLDAVGEGVGALEAGLRHVDEGAVRAEGESTVGGVGVGEDGEPGTRVVGEDAVRGVHAQRDVGGRRIGVGAGHREDEGAGRLLAGSPVVVTRAVPGRHLGGRGAGPREVGELVDVTGRVVGEEEVTGLVRPGRPVRTAGWEPADVHRGLDVGGEVDRVERGTAGEVEVTVDPHGVVAAALLSGHREGRPGTGADVDRVPRRAGVLDQEVTGAVHVAADEAVRGHPGGPSQVGDRPIVGDLEQVPCVGGTGAHRVQVVVQHVEAHGVVAGRVLGADRRVGAGDRVELVELPRDDLVEARLALERAGRGLHRHRCHPTPADESGQQGEGAHR